MSTCLCIRVQLYVSVCLPENLSTENMLIRRFNHAYTYCTWYRKMSTHMDPKQMVTGDIYSIHLYTNSLKSVLLIVATIACFDSEQHVPDIMTAWCVRCR